MSQLEHIYETCVLISSMHTCLLCTTNFDKIMPKMQENIKWLPNCAKMAVLLTLNCERAGKPSVD